VRNSNTTLILGARGRLGAALAGLTELGQVIAPDRSVYASWTRPDAADEVSAYLDRLALHPASTRLLVASGVTDPALPYDDHDRVNYILPENVVRGARRSGFEVVTFGTIMELMVSDGSSNSYLRSKVRLADFIQDRYATDDGVLHVRIHTLYGGGPPAKFMFLGQICEALAHGTRFEMSDGTQLREYHHVDDEVVAIARLLECDARGIVELNHGQPIQLRDLALHIFTAFGCRDRLTIGARPMAEHENLRTVFQRPRILEGVRFRDARAAVVDYLKACIHQ